MANLIQLSLLYCYIVWLAPNLRGTEKSFHPLHVSTTDINLNPRENRLEVICTIFTDDFEAALAKQFQVATDLSRADMHTAMDEVIKKYLRHNLQIKTGTSIVGLNYLGFEKENEVVNVYLESNKVSAFKTVEAQVSLLHNLFDDQLNIIHITVNGVRKSARLDYPDKKISQTF